MTVQPPQPNYNIWIRDFDETLLNPNTAPLPAPQVDPTIPFGAAGLPQGLKRIGLVTNYTKLEMKSRYNNVGGWTLEMEDGTPQATMLRQLCIGSSTDGPTQTSSGRGYGGITVTRDGEIIFSGPVRGFVASGDYTGEDGPLIEFYGTDDTGYLARRVAMVKAPGTGTTGDAGDYEGTFIPPANQGWGFWVFPEPPIVARSTTDVMFSLVYDNIGPYAPYPGTIPYTYIYPGPGVPLYNSNLIARRIPFLRVPQPSGAGPRYRIRTRYQNLLEKCQEVATYVQTNPAASDYDPEYRGLQFSISQITVPRPPVIPPQTPTTIDVLTFNYGLPTDRRTSVIFSEGLGNLGSYRYSLDSPDVNLSIVAGQGESTDRWFAFRGAQVGNSIMKYGLAEGFLDRRDIQYDDPIPMKPPAGTAPQQQAYADMIDEFIRAMDVQLREDGEVIELEVEVIDVSPTKYFVDYFLGDIVTVRIEGQDIVGQVMDVTITLTKAEGELIRPTIGTQVIGSTFRLFNQIYGIRKNIGTLEKSK